MAEPQKATERKQRVASAFNLAADTYDNLEHLRRIATRLVEIAALQRGESVLDVATGTGSAALAAARAVGPSGHVAGIDIAVGMLEQARQKVAASGLTNVELREGDGEALPFPDESFDVVLCASSLQFMPNKTTALQDWRRVLRPMGRVAFSNSPWGAGRLGDLVASLEHKYGIGITPPPPEERLTDPAVCRGFLETAGFRAIQVYTESVGYWARDADHYWQIMHSSFRRQDLMQLPVEQRDSFKAELFEGIQELLTEKGLWVEQAMNFAIGQK